MRADTIRQKWQGNRNIALFLISQTISLLGSAIVQYAIMWFITLKTQSGIMMTISIISSFLPTFFLSPIAGVWADRYNRKMLIVMSDAFIAATTFILAILFFMGYNTIWLLFAASAIRALGSAIQTPAVNAFIPLLVEKEQLTRVNAINGSIQSAMMFISPMISGALLTVAQLEVIFFLDVVTAVIAILVLVFTLHVPAHQKASEVQNENYLDDLKAGFSYVTKHGFIKRYMIFSAFFMLFMAPAAFLTPLQVTRTFGEAVWRLTAIELSFSVGMMAGGIAMASWGGFANRIHTMAVACIVMAVCTIGLGTIPIFWLYLVLMGFFGFVMPMFQTPSMVIVQETVEPDFLGRVFGLMGMIGSCAMPLGMLVFGPLADLIPIEWLLAGTGLILMLISILFRFDRILLEAGKPNPQQTDAGISLE